jgi:hypothetical protein
MHEGVFGWLLTTSSQAPAMQTVPHNQGYGETPESTISPGPDSAHGVVSPTDVVLVQD